MKTKLLALLFLVGSAAFAGPRIAIGVGVGPIGVGVAPAYGYYAPPAPAVAYVAPAPVYYGPRAYYGPRWVGPRYYGPAYYAPGITAVVTMAAVGDGNVVIAPVFYLRRHLSARPGCLRA
jgi:hypothetical protein